MHNTSSNQTIPVGNFSQLDIDYNALPDLLSKGVHAFKTKEEKLLFLQLAITVASGLLTKVKGQYRQGTVNTNLYCVGMARPASGKGLISYVDILISKVQEHFLNQSEEALKKYRSELLEYKRNRKNDSNAKPPSRKPFKVVRIPANCTSSKLIQHIQDNHPDVPTIMIEAEVDALVAAMESDLTYSDILRKGFHGEIVSISRKTEAEYATITNWKMAVAMVGTPNQFVKLVNNRSDGLMSRFMVNIIDKPPVISGIRPCPGCPNLTEVFNRISKNIFDLWKFQDSSELKVDLTLEHWEALQEYLDKKLEKVVQEHGDDAAQIILRHGLMAFKICMILTAIRKFEYREIKPEMICSPDDFNIAMAIIGRSIDDSLIFYEMLPDISVNRKTGHKLKFLNYLPESFSRQQAIDLGLSNKVSTSSIDRWLGGFVKQGILLQVGPGHYKKTTL
jgi:hypothetical protein